MIGLRKVRLPILLALFSFLPTVCADGSFAQATPPATDSPTPQDPPAGQGAPGGKGNQGQQNQVPQTVGPIVAGPGSTVVAPAPSGTNNSGLIVAAPGSTVVVQQVQPASQAAKSSTAKTNSFSTSKADLSTIDDLGLYANTETYNFRKRAGAIDALGILGAGADDVTATAIAKHLGDVLKNEYINPPPPAANLPAPPPLLYRDQTSEFLCFHVVQAAGNLGWAARSILPQLQMLRGQNPILDAAIDRAVIAMQNSPAPQNAKQNADQGSGTQNTLPTGQ